MRNQRRTARVTASPLLVLLVPLPAVRSEYSRAQTQRFAQFENEGVAVYNSVVLPNAPLTRQGHRRIIVALHYERLYLCRMDHVTGPPLNSTPKQKRSSGRRWQ